MAVYSQNGFLANDTDVLAWTTVPGTTVRFRLRKGAVTDVLTWLASRFDDEVEDIDTAGSFISDARLSIPGGEPSTLRDDWSYAPRPIRGSTTTLSNHASGTAIDLNATQHPRGVRGTFTAAQVKRVRAILAALRDPTTGRCVVRWGEDYQTAPTDGMHFEINADEAAVKRVAATLGDDMAITQADAEKIALEVWRYDQQGKKRQAWAYIQTAAADQTPALAAAVKAQLPVTGTPTQAQLEQALRNVLGSLDDN